MGLAKEHTYISPANVKRAIDHVNYGYWLKSKQLKNQWNASCAFRFIEEAAQNLVQSLEWDDSSFSGLSIYFDTDEHIFRHTFKRQEY
jgi:hypothetical protein